MVSDPEEKQAKKPQLPAELDQERFLAQHHDIASSAGFAHFQRIATMYSQMDLIPKHLRGKVGDCTALTAMAARMREDPLMVMQQCYVVHGRPGWGTEFYISRFNRLKVGQPGGFKSGIRWQKRELEPKTLPATRTTKDKRSGQDQVVEWDMPNLEIVAVAVDDNGELCESTAVTTEMAIAEGWVQNAKYQSMPEHMLRFRSAAFFIRHYAPEVMMSSQTLEELETSPQIIDVTPGSAARLPSLGELLDAEPEKKPEEPAGAPEEAAEAPPPAEPSPGPSEEPEEPATDPEWGPDVDGRPLSAQQISNLKKVALRLGVEWEHVEDLVGGPLDEVSIEGMTPRQIEEQVARKIANLGETT